MSKRGGNNLWDLDRAFGLPDLFDLGRVRQRLVDLRLPALLGERAAPDLPRLELDRPATEPSAPLPPVLAERNTMARAAPLPDKSEVEAWSGPVDVPEAGKQQAGPPDWWAGLLSLLGVDNRAEEAEAAIDQARLAAGRVTPAGPTAG